MSEGGKCFVGDCYDPRQCGKMAQMHSPAFRALSFPPLENCTKELEEGFHSLFVTNIYNFILIEYKKKYMIWCTLLFLFT